MVSRQYIKDMEFNNIEELFNYIIESKMCGNYKQTKEIIKKLSSKQWHDFIGYLHSTEQVEQIDKMIMLRMREEA